MSRFPPPNDGLFIVIDGVTHNVKDLPADVQDMIRERTLKRLGEGMSEYYMAEARKAHQAQKAL